MVRRREQLDLANVFQAAMQKDLLRRYVARVGIGADRLKAKGPEPVVDDGRGRFPSIPVAQ